MISATPHGEHGVKPPPHIEMFINDPNVCGGTAFCAGFAHLFTPFTKVEQHVLTEQAQIQSVFGLCAYEAVCWFVLEGAGV